MVKWGQMEKVLLVLGLLVMVYNLLYGLRLKRAVPGGVIGERSGQMLFLIAFFALAYLDEDLLGYPEVWAAGGTPRALFRATPKELLALTGAQVADLKEG